MKRTLSGLASILLTAALAGCRSSAPTTACAPRGNAITICLNGRPIDFSAAKTQPHIHETGSLYAPVIPLARALNLPVQVDASQLTVTVNGHPVKAVTSKTFKGIHQHGDEVFVPLREFVQAAGLTVGIQADGYTAGIAR